ncbi:MAG TPA: hypothetical protein VH253_14815 [Phycisphaerae bacterium]|nr:hypothetical protein [Phycisphaerae bacterium]
MTQYVEETPDATSRHWLYGTNLAVLVAIGVTIIAIALYASAKYTRHWDITSGGIYSLSDSTKKLLAEIDQDKKQYVLVDLFRADEDPRSAEHAQRVDDLVNDYARRCRNITVDDEAAQSRDALAQKVMSRYAGELKPYQDAIADYPKVSKDVADLAKDEAPNMSALAQQQGTNQQAAQVAVELYSAMSTEIPDELTKMDKAVKRETDSTVPRWGSLVTALKDPLGQIQSTLNVLATPAQTKQAFPPAIADYFAKAAGKYKAVADELSAYIDRLNKLKPLSVEDVLASAQPNTIVVLGPSSAKVLTDYDIFKPSPADQQNPQASGTEEFDGEQAVSSALVSMARPDKVKVVFVTSTPRNITTSGDPDSWTEITSRLKDLNFDVMEWSPPGPPTSPDQPPPSPNPPAQGKGVVWIVFPPSPPSAQQMMSGAMPDPKPLIDALHAHIAAGGNALLLADATGGNPLMGMSPGGDTYAFDDVAKSFGILVQPKYMAVWNYSTEGQSQVIPVISVTRFEQHEITKPLAALQTVFEALQSPTGGMEGAPTSVTVDSTLPKDVNVHELVQTPNDADHWGETNFSENATFNKGTDLLPPIGLAAASVKDSGDKAKEQRLVVIGSSTLGADRLVNQQGLARVGNEVMQIYVYPGNAELVDNSVLWLAGYENMIAVSAKAGVAMRIGPIGPGTMTFMHWMIYLGIPALALLAGGVVWAVRRR